MRKKVAVILVNWNSFQVTSDCIESLSQMIYHDFAIIVVDNGSIDQSGEKLKEKHTDIILIKSDSNLGFTGGNNLGMQFAIQNEFEYQILLNNDTFVKNDFLITLVNYMDENPTIGAIQPLIYFNHDRNLVWNGGSYFNHWLGYAHTDNYHKTLQSGSECIKAVDWVTGCAFFTRSKVLQEVGLLAENLFIYYEDVDLSFRIKKAGYQLMYLPESIIYHIAGMSNKNSKKGKEGYVNPIVHFLNVRNRIWLLKQYSSILQLPSVILYNFFYIIALMAYFVARCRFIKLKTVINAVQKGLFGKIIY